MSDAARIVIRQHDGRQPWMACILAAILLFLAACVTSSDESDGQPVPPSPGPSVAMTPAPGTSTEAAPLPSTTSFMRPTSVILPTQQPPPPVIEAVVARAAEDHGVSISGVTVVSFEARTWPSTALGCPEPGRSYAQIVTPGFIVTLSIDEGTIAYHADETGAAIVRCDRLPGA